MATINNDGIFNSIQEIALNIHNLVFWNKKLGERWRSILCSKNQHMARADSGYYYNIRRCEKEHYYETNINLPWINDMVVKDLDYYVGKYWINMIKILSLIGIIVSYFSMKNWKCVSAILGLILYRFYKMGMINSIIVRYDKFVYLVTMYYNKFFATQILHPYWQKVYIRLANDYLLVMLEFIELNKYEFPVRKQVIVDSDELKKKFHQIWLDDTVTDKLDDNMSKPYSELSLESQNKISLMLEIVIDNINKYLH